MELGGVLRRGRLYESRAAIAAYKALRAGFSRVGLQVVLKTFYSPIPEVRELPPGVFDRVSELHGVEWDLDGQLRFVSERLAQPMAEFTRRRGNGDRWQYTPENPSYGLLDATVLYGMIRALNPARVVELGSGHSTLVTAAAGRANAADGHPMRLEAFDPYPGVVSDDLPGLTALHRVAAQDVPMPTFEQLDEGDVLFVDTTHTVRIGSDVNFIVLEVLPRLAPGVVVHIHDIFLPHEYPRRWLEDFGLYWNEQYLVHAFLALNSGYEVVCAVAALRKQRGRELEAVLPPGVAEQEGSAFWLRRLPAL
jgi:hypothetical protein